jgi:hypothetical protein
VAADSAGAWAAGSGAQAERPGENRRLRRYRWNRWNGRNRRGDEAGAQEPVIREVAGVKSAPEQIVGESPAAQFAVREAERARRRNPAIGCLDDQNAVRDSLRAWAGRVADIELRRACSRAAVNDQSVGWRAVPAEIGIEHDSAAHTGIVDGRQRLVAGELRRVANGRREDDRARIGVDQACDVRTAGHVPDCAALQRHIRDAASGGDYRARE